MFWHLAGLRYASVSWVRMKNNKTSGAKNVLADLVIPTIALLFTVYYLSTITEVPWISQASALTVSCLLVMAVVAFAIRTVLRIRRGEETIRLPGAFTALFGTRSIAIKRLALFALTVGYVLFIESLGFVLSTFVFVALGIVVLSSLANIRRAALVALTCSSIGYIVFIYFFNTRFPKGPIEHFLKGLL